VVLSGEIKPARVIPELLDHAIADLNGGFEPPVLKRQFIEREKAVDEIGVVIKVCVEAGATIFIAMEQAIAVPQSCENEIRVGNGNIAIVGAIETCGGLRERAQHQSIPIGQDFFIAARPHALFPRGI
jgi:hypothetical protein